MTVADITQYQRPAVLRTVDHLEVLMRVFVTGATGWIGSALIPELIGAGHQVTGLARSDASSAALTAAGAEVHRGTLDDLDGLREAAAAAEGVIHLAFKHDIAFSGGFQDAADADRRAIETFGEALPDSDPPFIIASGTPGRAPRTPAAGVPLRGTAEVTGRCSAIPAGATPPRDERGPFGWRRGFPAVAGPASRTLARELTGSHPPHTGLLDAPEKGPYFHNPPA